MAYFLENRFTAYKAGDTYNDAFQLSKRMDGDGRRYDILGKPENTSERGKFGCIGRHCTVGQRHGGNSTAYDSADYRLFAYAVERYGNNEHLGH